MPSVALSQIIVKFRSNILRYLISLLLFSMVLSNKISFIKTNTASKTAPAQTAPKHPTVVPSISLKGPTSKQEKLAATKHSNQTSTQNSTQTSKRGTKHLPHSNQIRHPIQEPIRRPKKHPWARVSPSSEVRTPNSYPYLGKNTNHSTCSILHIK